MEEVQKCVNSQKREKWIYAVYRKPDAEGKKLDLLVAEVGNKSCGGLEIMME